MKNIIEWTLKAGTLLMVFGFVVAVIGIVFSLISVALEEVQLWLG